VDKLTQLVEFESMLVVRHGSLQSAKAAARNQLLDRSAYVLLSLIQLEGPMSISQLSNALTLDVSTLNRQTAAMLRAGLVDRIPDPDGGIARKFHISDLGTERINAHRAENARGLEMVLEHWSPEDVATLGLALRRFNRDIERLEGISWPRPPELDDASVAALVDRAASTGVRSAGAFSDTPAACPVRKGTDD